ncbi:AAA family ATPase [Fusibacter bizertensis]
MKKIAIYGKGGIGKSTTVSNISAALALQGYKVMQIGCDPKADSTRNLTEGSNIPTVLNVLKEQEDIALEDIVFTGDLGVLCVEAGGPVPGVGCAGRGIITAFETLESLNAYETYQPDFVIYDVLGDVVCGGFAMPIRGGYADEVCIVTSGEMMSLYAASNICHAVKSFGKRGYASLKGFIYNGKNFEGEDALVYKAAEEAGTEVICKIERDGIVQKSEAMGKTVVSAYPESAMTAKYIELSKRLFGL